MWLAGNRGPFQLIEKSVEIGVKYPFTILHISDLHFAPGQNKKAGYLEKLAELRPDLVINTGDNLGHAQAINPTLAALAPLMELPGVFVNGSNDYRAPKPRNPLNYLKGPSKTRRTANLDTNRFTRELETAGWLNLNNQAGSMNIKGTKLGFLGLDDPHENLDNLQGLTKQRLRVESAEVLFGIAHAPYLRVIESFTKLDASLIFAGHTHGGQVCLPGQRALVTNCDLPTQYASGLSAWEFGDKQSMLHVSQGLGCSIYAPVRIFCPPSATLLTIS
jgi:predicted MPP superfamily phosphohydrolase